jgi:plastocyanin
MRATSRRRQWTRISVLALVVTGVGVAGCGDDDDGEQATSASAPVSLPGQVTDHGTSQLGDATELDLELDDQYFAPTFVEGAAGSTVQVTLENEGSLPHTFTIDEADIDEEVGAGERATVEVTLPDSGSLRFYCRFHSGSGMQGAFVVSGGASVTTQPASSGGVSGY